MNKQKVSVKLSYLLRHNPGEFGVSLEKGGWASVESVLKGMGIDMTTLEDIFREDSKGRYSFNEDKTKCRANQGHSVNIDLDLESRIPPCILYHGTVEEVLAPIFESGLKKMQRHHVHLSETLDTAEQVAGRRRSRNVILEIDAEGMSKDGHLFYRSENGVWLTDSVPPKYLKEKQ